MIRYLRAGGQPYLIQVFRQSPLLGLYRQDSSETVYGGLVPPDHQALWGGYDAVVMIWRVTPVVVPRRR